MNKILLILLLIVPIVVAADDSAYEVVTPGYGRLEIVSNYILFSSGSSYDAIIPRRIMKGDRINVTYKKENKQIRGVFDVVRISVKKELCRLHNKERSRYETSPGDTIYIKQCLYR